VGRVWAVGEDVQECEEMGGVIVLSFVCWFEVWMSEMDELGWDGIFVVFSWLSFFD